MCLRNWWPFWSGGCSYQLTTMAYKYQPKLTHLKPPQFVISHSSVGWLGARQWSSADLSWSILCSQLESLYKLAYPPPHDLASQSGGLRVLGIKGEASEAFWGQTLEVTHHHFHHTLLLKTRQGPAQIQGVVKQTPPHDGRNNEWCVTSFIPELSSMSMNLIYWTHTDLLSIPASLAESTVNVPPMEQYPQAHPKIQRVSIVVDTWNKF